MSLALYMINYHLFSILKKKDPGRISGIIQIMNKKTIPIEFNYIQTSHVSRQLV